MLWFAHFSKKNVDRILETQHFRSDARGASAPLARKEIMNRIYQGKVTGVEFLDGKRRTRQTQVQAAQLLGALSQLPARSCRVNL
jgi:hypothetical protein